jgi:large subunit ribosomal protein L22
MAAVDDTSAITVRAQARWVRLSARKARVVLEHIRGRSVPEARTILVFTQRAAAHEIGKVLDSAIANAESAHGLDGDELVVTAAYADEGPTLKRWRARARGRANRIRKRTCHITVVLSAAETQRPRRSQGAKAPESASAPTEAGGTTAEEPKAPRRRPTKKKEAVA